MKIGIIVYSQTGNTFSVAEKLKAKLTAAGHNVNIERLTTVGGEDGPEEGEDREAPGPQRVRRAGLCRTGTGLFPLPE